MNLTPGFVLSTGCSEDFQVVDASFLHYEASSGADNFKQHLHKIFAHPGITAVAVIYVLFTIYKQYLANGNDQERESVTISITAQGLTSSLIQDKMPKF